MYYTVDSRIVQINNLKYANFILEKYPFVFSNTETTIIIGGLEIYEYIAQQIGTKNIKVSDTVHIELSLFDNTMTTVDWDNEEFYIKFDNTLRISKIRVFNHDINYSGIPTDEKDKFKILWKEGSGKPPKAVLLPYVCNKYDDYTAERSWENNEYSWVYDPQ